MWPRHKKPLFGIGYGISEHWKFIDEKVIFRTLEIVVLEPLIIPLFPESHLNRKFHFVIVDVVDRSQINVDNDRRARFSVGFFGWKREFVTKSLCGTTIYQSPFLFMIFQGLKEKSVKFVQEPNLLTVSARLYYVRVFMLKLLRSHCSPPFQYIRVW